MGCSRWPRKRPSSLSWPRIAQRAENLGRPWSKKQDQGLRRIRFHDQKGNKVDLLPGYTWAHEVTITRLYRKSLYCYSVDTGWIPFYKGRIRWMKKTTWSDRNVERDQNQSRCSETIFMVFVKSRKTRHPPIFFVRCRNKTDDLRRICRWPHFLQHSGVDVMNIVSFQQPRVLSSLRQLSYDYLSPTNIAKILS